ncbi:hypothetical protein [Muribaculum intestinale]|uniref:hypothetical protein n=1 Tax=Muribaculum intestinale TaxID=1796646 RepID=UPI003F674CA6
MSKLYDDVKKQGEQLDDLQKKVTSHGTRIETLETKGMATPPPAQPVSPESITVKLPEDIATNESIGKLLDAKLSATSADGILKEVIEKMPGSLSKEVADVLSDNLGVKVKDALYEGFRKEFADERNKLYNVISDLRYKVQSLVAGQWWLATPKWVYAIFAILLLATGGFGYGFFYQLNENSKLKDVEWLYRNQRTAYKTDEARQFLMNTERDFMTRTWQERDSIKNNIRYWEKERGLDKTYLYFNPTEE